MTVHRAGGPQPYAVITGASSGIGAAFARRLSAEGYVVGLVARGRSSLEKVAEQLPGPVVVLPTDLADPTELAALEQLLLVGGSPVDLLVNNAATGRYGRFVDHDSNALSDTVLVNVVAVMRLTRAVLPNMVESRAGGIINVSSPVGLIASPGLAPYAASKAAVDSFTRTLRVELDGTGVVVTLVRPDWTRTGFHARLGQDVSDVPDATWQGADVVATESLAAHRRGRAVVRVPPQTLGDAVTARARAAVPEEIASLVRRTRRRLRGV